MYNPDRSYTKPELLAEMVDYQGRVKSHGLEGNKDLIREGIGLFSAINKVANTPELNILTNKYLQYLKSQYNVIKHKHLRVIK